MIRDREEVSCPSEHDVAPVVGTEGARPDECSAAAWPPTGRSGSTQAISRASLATSFHHGFFESEIRLAMTKLRRVLPIAALSAVLVLPTPPGAVASTLSQTPAGKLSVVAGDGKSGPPTPGAATKSALSGPYGVALDAHGDLFIADTGNDVVEEVTLAGRLSVVAGDAKSGPPTPGVATKSALSGPYGVALDAHGDLFIADTGNNVVEEVTPAGRLSVVAGDGKSGPPTPGVATKSALHEPYGSALDAHGDLFIADYGNKVVEKVTPAGKLSVVAGDGNVTMPTPGPATRSAINGPTDVALGPHGDLFIADNDNAVVEKVTPAGKLSVVAGDGKPIPPTPGPATKSAISAPRDVAVDAHGDLFISDDDDSLVLEVTPAGWLSIAAGNGAGNYGTPTPGPATRSALAGPQGVAVDAQGDLFIADQGNNVVEKVTF